MFGNGIKLFKLFGFEIKVDISWMILIVLITWSLSTGFFPAYYSGLIFYDYLWMGIAGAIGLFLSIIFHELSHSLVARRYGTNIKGITLFILGGIAEMQEESKNPKSEFLIAIAGPLSSIVIGSIFFSLYIGSQVFNWPIQVIGILIYLFVINIVLAIFNLLPAYPMDGGRIFRAALWGWKKDINWATKISTRVGSIFGFTLIFLGVVIFIIGNFISGVWWVLIGMFLRFASKESYNQLVYKQELEGLKVSKFMNNEPIMVPGSISVSSFVDNYIYKYHYKTYPIVNGSEIKGCISLKDVKDLPREKWKDTTVNSLIHECSNTNTIQSESKASDALLIMQRTGNSRLLVVDEGILKGIISLKDLLRYLNLKKDLES